MAYFYWREKERSLFCFEWQREHWLVVGRCDNMLRVRVLLTFEAFGPVLFNDALVLALLGHFVMGERERDLAKQDLSHRERIVFEHVLSSYTTKIDMGWREFDVCQVFLDDLFHALKMNVLICKKKIVCFENSEN